jgi:hypothetical protein
MSHTTLETKFVAAGVFGTLRVAGPAAGIRRPH